MRRFPWGAVAVLCAVTAACAPRGTGPGSQGLTPPRDIAEVLARQREGTRTLRATFRLKVRRDGREAMSTRGALVVARPDRLRLQLFSLGVMTVYDFTARGDRFRVRRPLDDETRIGRLGGVADADAGVAAELRPILLGSSAAPSGVEERGDAAHVRFDEPEGRREVVISRRDGSFQSEALRSAGGDLRVRARYSDHRLVDGLALPFRIAVDYPERQVSLDIEIERYTRNQPVEDGLFEF